MSLLQCRGTLCMEGSAIVNRNQTEQFKADESQALLTTDVNYQNQDFTFFFALNMPWCASKMRSAPLSKPNDGLNDIITSRRQQGAGNCSLLRLLLAQDGGDYFTQDGQVRPNLLIDYHKSKSWTLDPLVKGPR